MDAPKFSTAIPKRRYSYGDFSATLLGDIDSRDENIYRFIMAFVPEGAAQPVFFVTSEKNRRSESQNGSHRMRMITDAQGTVLDSSDDWADADVFCEAALKIASSVLSLNDVEPFRVM